MKYVRKEAVEAYTFEEFIQYGRGWYDARKLQLQNGMPWSFNFYGLAVTHEQDDLYLITGQNAMVPAGQSSMSFGPTSVLVHWPSGEWSVQSRAEFMDSYKPA